MHFYHYLVVVLLTTTTLPAQEARPAYDYYQPQRELIRRGVQSLLMCNGLFTSGRTVEQVFDEELAYLPELTGTAKGGNYTIDRRAKTVMVGSAGGPIPPARTVFRPGLGCVVLPPDQSFTDLGDLPQLTLPKLTTDPAELPWPDGDATGKITVPAGVSKETLQAASDWAFNRPTPEQKTISLVIVHKGDIIHERYAPGFTRATRTRTWSTAKSIGATLIGMQVDRGKLTLDEPLDIEWLPREGDAESDPRRSITLRHVLNMSSGLYTVDSRGMEYATGSGLAYWAGASSAVGARDRGLVRRPGTHWDYENYDTLLGILAMKKALGNDKTYLEYPRTALFDKIGMRNTVVSPDRFGDFIFSSQVYTNARDLARFGLLYLNGGVWNEEQLISESWIDFVRTPAPALNGKGEAYGGQWWLVPTDRTDVPKDAYATAGNRGQFVIVVPSHDLVIVRRGLDYGRQGFDRWDLAREVVKAVE